MSLADTPISELQHHGVLGMHWGRRKGPQAVAKSQQKWDKKAGKASNFVAAHNAAANRMNNGGIAEFNSRPKYKGLNFSKDSPARRAYYKDAENNFNKVFNEEMTKRLGPRPENADHVTTKISPDGSTIHVSSKDVAHADEPVDVTYRLKKDATGRIIALEPMSTDMSQADADIDALLEHFGVKGMHWGQRMRARETVRLQKKSDKLQGVSDHFARLRDGKPANTKERIQRGALLVSNFGSKKLTSAELQAHINVTQKAKGKVDQRLHTPESERKMSPRTKKLLIGGGIAAALVLDLVGETAIGNLRNPHSDLSKTIITKAHANRTAATLSNIRGLPSVATATSFAKRGRGGAFKVTSL